MKLKYRLESSGFGDDSQVGDEDESGEEVTTARRNRTLIVFDVVCVFLFIQESTKFFIVDLLTKYCTILSKPVS